MTLQEKHTIEIALMNATIHLTPTDKQLAEMLDIEIDNRKTILNQLKNAQRVLDNLEVAGFKTDELNESGVQQEN